MRLGLEIISGSVEDWKRRTDAAFTATTNGGIPEIIPPPYRDELAPEGNPEALAARIDQAGGSVESSIESKPWGERIFYARDPFGNPIAFVDASTAFRGR